MKFIFVKGEHGINEYVSEDGLWNVEFNKYSRTVKLINKRDGEKVILLYEELAALFYLTAEEGKNC